jgi:phage gp36-like protein
MSYVTNADIEAWLGTRNYIALTDDSGSGAADVAKINEARTGAEGEVNSYLATRYQVPVSVSSESEVAAVLRTITLDLVAYRLHTRRPPVPPDIVRRHDEAVTWLNRAAIGVVQLPSAQAMAVNTALGTVGQAAGPERAMTRDGLQDL